MRMKFSLDSEAHVKPVGISVYRCTLISMVESVSCTGQFIFRHITESPHVRQMDSRSFCDDGRWR